MSRTRTIALVTIAGAASWLCAPFDALADGRIVGTRIQHGHSGYHQGGEYRHGGPLGDARPAGPDTIYVRDGRVIAHRYPDPHFRPRYYPGVTIDRSVVAVPQASVSVVVVPRHGRH